MKLSDREHFLNSARCSLLDYSEQNQLDIQFEPWHCQLDLEQQSYGVLNDLIFDYAWMDRWQVRLGEASCLHDIELDSDLPAIRGLVNLIQELQDQWHEN